MNIQSDEVTYFFSVEARSSLTNSIRNIQGIVSTQPLTENNFSDFKKAIEDKYKIERVEFLALNRT
jgi:hypothetical protein